jgi:hypothetical protein
MEELDLPQPPPLDVPKQEGGTRASRSPIVRLISTPDDAQRVVLQCDPNNPRERICTIGAESCGATFIAKNWAITAAHCIDHTKNVAKDAGVPLSAGWGTYGFMPAIPAGGDPLLVGGDDKAHYFECPRTLVIPDPRYLGFGLTGLHGFDFALVYVHEDCNRKMPVVLDPDPKINGSAPFMPISADLKIIKLNGEGFWWGYGPHLLNRSNPDVYETESPPYSKFFVHRLTFGETGTLANYPDFDNSRVQGTGLFRGEIPASGYGGPWLCRGDSGSPLSHRFSLSRPNQLLTVRDVVSGVVVDGQIGDIFDGFHNCFMQGGDGIIWQPTASEIDFIQREVARWQVPEMLPGPVNASAACRDWKVETVPATLDAHAIICSGDPCTTENECCQQSPRYPKGTGVNDCEKQRWFCSKPAKLMKEPCLTDGTLIPPPAVPGVPVCPPPFTSCGCIKGQCQPAPNLGQP